MQDLHLEVSTSEAGAYGRHTTKVRRDGHAESIEIFHEFDRARSLVDETPLEGYVLPLFLYAAAAGKRLRVHGALSRTAMLNFEELSLLWNRWKPSVYHKIDIMPDRIVDPLSQANRPAVAAFSGGVDATFTALRHAVSGRQDSPDARYPLTSVLMVHGFDVDVFNFEDFQRLVARIRPFLEDLNLDLHVMRTNSRDLRLQSWDDSSALQLGGCLQMLASDFRFGLIASGKAYDGLIFPAGSSPVGDHLMSGDQMAIVHDGAAFSRTDKVNEIARNEAASRTLKVCWAGADQSKNCGRCEKCVRTKLNFLATGVKSMPPAFSEELDLELIQTIQIDRKTQLAELAGLLDYADAHGVDGTWAQILRSRIAGWTPPDATALQRRIQGSPVKRGVAKFFAALGVEEPVKRVWRKSRREVLKRVS